MADEAADPTPDPIPSLMDAPPADPAPEEKVDADKAGPDPSDPAGDPADPAGSDPDPAGGDDGEGGEDGDEDAPEGAPEEYADFAAPEGVTLDAEAIDAFKPIAKELNLTQEQAQKLVDIQAQTAQRWAEGVQQHVIDTRLGWREAAQSDEEIGGKDFAANLAVAKLGRDTFGNEALKTLLDETGIGDHPEVIRFFYKVGKANSEHDFVTSGKPEERKSFYDHPTSKK